MGKLDRAIIAEVMRGNAVFTDPIANRFAKVGLLELCRNITERWHLVIAHDNTHIHQIKLGILAHLALSCAAMYHKRNENSERAKP